MSWRQPFPVPIQLPDGKKLVTLADARRYLLALSASRQPRPAINTAIEALLLAAEFKGPMMHAHIGMNQAIHGPKPIPESRPSKESAGSNPRGGHERRRSWPVRMVAIVCGSGGHGCCRWRHALFDAVSGGRKMRDSDTLAKVLLEIEMLLAVHLQPEGPDAAHTLDRIFLPIDSQRAVEAAERVQDELRTAGC